MTCVEVVEGDLLEPKPSVALELTGKRPVKAGESGSRNCNVNGVDDSYRPTGKMPSAPPLTIPSSSQSGANKKPPLLPPSTTSVQESLSFPACSSNSAEEALTFVSTCHGAERTGTMATWEVKRTQAASWT